MLSDKQIECPNNLLKAAKDKKNIVAAIVNAGKPLPMHSAMEAVKQNFKNLLLTSPGERVMLPDFGAGIKRLLFEPINSRTFSRVSQAIYAQVDKYMPFINIEDIQFTTYEIDPSLALNEVQLVVNYNLGSIDSSNTLKISQVND